MDDSNQSAQYSVPLSFPPYLSDADRNLQHAHCMHAAGGHAAGDALHDATCYLATELLGDPSVLLEADDEDFRQHLVGADALVQKALAALREAQLVRQKSKVIVNGIVDIVLKEAWFEIKLRNEWRVREAIHKHRSSSDTHDEVSFLGEVVGCTWRICAQATSGG